MPDPRFHDSTIAMLVTCPKCTHTHTVQITESELPSNPSERYYKLAEVEKMMGVSRRTLKQWIYDTKLHAVKSGNAKQARWFVPASALEEFRRKHQR